MEHNEDNCKIRFEGTPTQIALDVYELAKLTKITVEVREVTDKLDAGTYATGPRIVDGLMRCTAEVIAPRDIIETVVTLSKLMGFSSVTHVDQYPDPES